MDHLSAAPAPGEAGDAVVFEVLRTRLAGIVGEMQEALFRSGYSTAVRETQDASCALLDARGAVVAQHVVLPLHIGAFPACAAAVLEEFGDDLTEGDAYLLNDPHTGGSPHAPDLALIVPVFLDGALLGFAASMAHKVDIGGPVPGSCWNGATDVYGEGLQLPALCYARAGEVRRDLERLLAANSRAPALVLGDLRAQHGCAQLGADRLVALAQRHGGARLLWFFSAAIDAARRRIAEVVATWPEGSAHACREVDEDGVVPDRPLAVSVRVTVAAGRVRFDFTGTDPQSRGPANIRRPILAAACAYTLLAACGGEPYVNSGLLDAFDLCAPAGSLVDAAHPAPVNTYNPTVHAVIDACFAALGALVPAAARGDGGASRSIVCRADGHDAVQYEVFGGGSGARAGADGASGMTVDHSNCRITPIEVVETEYPVRVLETALLVDSGGPGAHRGGLGVRRRYALLEQTTISLRSTRHSVAPLGHDGGGPGRPGRALLRGASGGEVVLRPRSSGVVGAPGDELVLETPGGGGFGDPFAREPARVARDVAAGYCSPGEALGTYGVVVRRGPDGNVVVDDSATARARAGRPDATRDRTGHPTGRATNARAAT